MIIGLQGAKLVKTKFVGFEGSSLSLMTKDTTDKTCDANEMPWVDLESFKGI